MDMNEEEFTPELKVWALEHFNQMAAKAIWRPDGTGCRYRKIDETTMRLEHRIDHPDSIHHHERVTRLFATVNIEMLDDDVMVTPAALSAEDAFRQEMQERQAVAASWTTEDGTKLADLPLEEAEPVYLGEREILLDNGETSKIEDWAIRVMNDDEEILMNPDDYNLLAGDDLFMRYKNELGYLTAMTRQQMFDSAETNALGVLVGGTCPDTGVKVPPWMWGTYCSRDYSLDGEE